MRIAPSSVERIEACPGSRDAESQCAYEKESEVQKEGKILHAAMLPNADLSKLTLEQKRYIEVAKDHARILWEEFKEGQQDYHFRQEISGLARLDDRHSLSGRLDFIAWASSGAGRTLIIDWKFGRIAVEGATDNLQTRAYAIIGADYAGPRDNAYVDVVIVQPTVDWEHHVTRSRYYPEDLVASRVQLIAIADAATEPKAERRPGEHCRYCKALGTSLCPESVEQASALAKFEQADLLPTGAELGVWLERGKVAKAIVEMLEDHAKNELRAGREISGWKLKPDQEIRTLPDIPKVWAKVENLVPAEDFMALCKMGIGDLEAYLAKKQGWPAKLAKAQFNDLLGDAITMGTKAGSLEKVK